MIYTLCCAFVNFFLKIITFTQMIIKFKPYFVYYSIPFQILAHMDEYDTTLESLSKLIERKVKYDINDSGEMTVNNASEIEALYRFPDLTNHTVFLARAIQSTVNKDVPEELHFLRCYDELKRDIQSIVDMPDNKVDRMILFLHQNKGKLASRKRNFYKELSDNEIEQMEQAYTQVFERK